MRSTMNQPSPPSSGWPARLLGVLSKTSRPCVLLMGLSLLFFPGVSGAANITFGSSLKFMIDDSSKMQIRRGYDDDSLGWPLSTFPNVVNGIYFHHNAVLYGPNISGYTATIGSTPFSSVSLVKNTTTHATHSLSPGGTSPRADISWDYTSPNSYITATVSVIIPSGYSISAANPLRYYHVLQPTPNGDWGGTTCGLSNLDAGRRRVGAYPGVNSACSSTTVVPTGRRFVGFIERGSLVFSSYSVDNFDTLIHGANGPIKQKSTLSNSVVTDAPMGTAGVAIEYSFTATGSYSFSYDIVSGALPPPIDHLEIRHEGKASTACSSNVMVLACKTTELPCLDANIITDQTITGKLTAAGATASFNPVDFSVGSSTSATASVAMSATSTGILTLGSANLPQTPTNGTRCFNTTTSKESCDVAVGKVPCGLGGFECIATKQAYNNLQSLPKARNPLFTQLANTDFSFDVVALKVDGSALTGYVPDKTEKKVAVELFDDSKPPASCAAYNSPVATQSLAFATTDAGRKSVSFPALKKAYGTLRCRVTDPGDTTQKPPVEASTGCSSDTFTVRPQAITSISSTANADDAGVGAAKTPVVKVGVPFALTTNTDTPGYNGQPKVKPIPNPVTANSAAIQWAGAPSNGRVADVLNGWQAGVGVLSGNFGPADSASGNDASGSFAYDEVGYFQFKINSVYDDTYVDRSKDQANGDCVTASFSNTPDANGRYGCAFGNTENSKHFGRFIPDHFKTAVVQGCVTGNFTYSRQPFLLTVAAQNLTGGTTQNYIGTFAKALTLSAWNKENPAATVADPRGNLSLTSLLAANFGKDSTGTSLAGGGGVAMNNVLYAFVKPETELASLWLRAVDTEGVSSQDTANTGIYEANPQLHSGRVTMTNSFGPETLDLNVYFSAEHWMNGAWAINASDSCTGNTALTMPNPVPTNTVGITSNSNVVSVTLTPRSTPSIATCVIDATPSLSGAGCTSAGANLLKRFKKGIPNGTRADFAGNFNLWLKAPGAGKRGNLIVTGNVPQWLGTPSATVNFGARRTPWIYRQEVY